MADGGGGQGGEGRERGNHRDRILGLNASPGGSLSPGGQRFWSRPSPFLCRPPLSLSVTSTRLVCTTKKGVGVYYGIGTDEATADNALYADKARRTGENLRGPGGIKRNFLAIPVGQRDSGNRVTGQQSELAGPNRRDGQCSWVPAASLRPYASYRWPLCL